MSQSHQLAFIAFVIAALALLACLGPTRYGLVPPSPGPQNLREAEPTAQPVSSPDAFRDTADVPPFMRTPAAESASVSLAAALLMVASGAMPLIGVFGRFDENRLVEDLSDGCLRPECVAPADAQEP